MEWEKKGDSKKDFKKDMEGDVLSSSGQVQVRSSSCLVQVTAQI